MLAAFLLCAVPYSPIVETAVDRIEVNHFYDENGRLVFDQLIFYRLAEDGHSDVIAWRLVKCPAMLPYRCKGRSVVLWFDGDFLRRVVALSAGETWTQFDPELLERERLPTEHRAELGR